MELAQVTHENWALRKFPQRLRPHKPQTSAAQRPLEREKSFQCEAKSPKLECRREFLIPSTDTQNVLLLQPLLLGEWHQPRGPKS